MASVLVVDDEFGVAEVIEAILCDEQFQVVVAIDGQQALERLARYPADVVLTDYMMPLMDGAALSRALAQDPRYAQLPVILMSALPESAVRAAGARYVGFLRKPFRADALHRAIRDALGAENP